MQQCFPTSFTAGAVSRPVDLTSLDEVWGTFPGWTSGNRRYDSQHKLTELGENCFSNNWKSQTVTDQFNELEWKYGLAKMVNVFMSWRYTQTGAKMKNTYGDWFCFICVLHHRLIPLRTVPPSGEVNIRQYQAAMLLPSALKALHDWLLCWGFFPPQNGVFPELFPTGRQLTHRACIVCMASKRDLLNIISISAGVGGGGGVQTAPVSNVISLRDVIVRRC